jgi:hypothetical protein
MPLAFARHNSDCVICFRLERVCMSFHGTGLLPDIDNRLDALLFSIHPTHTSRLGLAAARK